MSSREAEISKRIQLAAPSVGCRLFRNTTGRLLNPHGGMVTVGLCVGSADLIGWVECATIAAFLAVEVKSATGRLSKEQGQFLDAVNRAGGLGLVARSAEEFTTRVAEWRERRAHGD